MYDAQNLFIEPCYIHKSTIFSQTGDSGALVYVEIDNKLYLLGMIYVGYYPDFDEKNGPLNLVYPMQNSRVGIKI